MKTTPIFLATLLAATTALLTACGGGGGGGGAAPAGSTTYTATCSDGTTRISTTSVADAAASCFGDTGVYASTIVTSVPADTYNAVTQAEEKAAFALLNQERNSCGFGMLAQNAMLDTAAKGHADWLLKNNYVGHNQVVGTLGFTGSDPASRISSAGYLGSEVKEGLTVWGGTSAKLNKGVVAVRGLLGAPYHAITILRETREVGIAIRNTTDVTSAYSPSVAAVFDYGYTASLTYQSIASNDVFTYPCQGTTGTGYRLRDETPNPVPNRNLATSPVGHPIIVMIRKDRVLTLTSATMTKVSTGAPIALRTPVTTANDPNGSSFGGHFGYVLPDVALEPSTQYQVTINGKNGATVFSRTFAFTTGAVDY